MQALIIIKEKQSQQILAEFDMEHSEAAFKAASEFESMGIDVEVIHPTAVESLGLSLGANQSDLEQVREELDQEIQDHESDSCCFNNK